MSEIFLEFVIALLLDEDCVVGPGIRSSCAVVLDPDQCKVHSHDLSLLGSGKAKMI